MMIPHKWACLFWGGLQGAGFILSKVRTWYHDSIEDEACLFYSPGRFNPADPLIIPLLDQLSPFGHTIWHVIHASLDRLIIPTCSPVAFSLDFLLDFLQSSVQNPLEARTNYLKITLLAGSLADTCILICNVPKYF